MLEFKFSFLFHIIVDKSEQEKLLKINLHS
nr:MAG TPA: hypothetical protein [Caudoviricetes sp.]